MLHVLNCVPLSGMKKVKKTKDSSNVILYRLKTMEDLRNIIETKAFQYAIVILILINAVTIGLETSVSFKNNFGQILSDVDKYILVIFCLEISLKLVAYNWRFFLNPWNIFDVLIIGIALVPATGPLQILRTLRILRTIRLVKNIPKLRVIIESLITSIPSIGWIIVLLFMIFYIFAVIATDSYGEAFPDYFGTLGKSFFSLFQIMTLESWSSGIARPMMKEMPYAYFFFVPFILLATYTTLNVFIAVVVNTMNEVNRKAIKEEEEKLHATIKEEHEEIMFHIKSMSRKLDRMELQIEEEKSKK
jgi:voltage-gated sodium channel